LAAPGDSRTDEERPEEVRDSNRKKKLLLNIKKTQQKTTANIPPVGLVSKKELDRQSLIERDTNSAHFVAAISVRAPLERARTHTKDELLLPALNRFCLSLSPIPEESHIPERNQLATGHNDPRAHSILLWNPSFGFTMLRTSLLLLLLLLLLFINIILNNRLLNFIKFR
jgi:hypothetical protein